MKVEEWTYINGFQFLTTTNTTTTAAAAATTTNWNLHENVWIYML